MPHPPSDVPPVVMDRHRTHLRQLVLSKAAKQHPGTFELYVPTNMQESKKRPAAKISEKSHVSLPPIPSAESQEPKVSNEGNSHEEGAVVVSPHPPLPKMFTKGEEQFGSTICRSFPFSKYHNMIFRKGTPPLPDVAFQWAVAPRVNTHRLPSRQKPDVLTDNHNATAPQSQRLPAVSEGKQLTSPRRNQPNTKSPRHMLVPVPPPAPSHRSEAHGPSKWEKIVKWLEQLEVDDRRTVVREYDGGFLKFMRLYEVLRAEATAPATTSKGDFLRSLKGLSSYACSNSDFDADVRHMLESEKRQRRIVAVQESEARSVIAKSFIKKIGLVAPEANAREAIRREQISDHLSLMTVELQSREETMRYVLEKQQRNLFDDFVLRLDLLHRSGGVEERERSLRQLIRHDEELERVVVQFHGSFRLVSLQELLNRLHLRQQLSEGVRRVEERDAAALRIQTIQRGLVARKELQRRKSLRQESQSTESAHREALGKVAANRSLLTQSLREEHRHGYLRHPPKGAAEVVKVTYSFCDALEETFLKIAELGEDSDQLDSLLEEYAKKKREFAMALVPFYHKNAEHKNAKPHEQEASSSLVSNRVRRVVELMLREPDSDRANIMLLTSLQQVPEIHLSRTIDEDGLLLMTIVDGSCNYFDALLGSNDLNLSRQECTRCIAAALGSPTKRILFAGTILRREKHLQLFSLRDELQPLWREFFWNVSCASTLFSEVEEGLNLRIPLLTLLMSHHNVKIDFSEIPFLQNSQQLSVLARLCREGEIDLVKSYVARAMQYDELAAAAITPSGSESVTPLAIACGAKQASVVKALVELPVVLAEERSNPCASKIIATFPDAERLQYESLLSPSPPARPETDE